MIANDKVTEIFCIADDFCKEFDKEVSKMGLESPPKKACQRNQTWRMSRSEIMTTLICFHLASFRNPKLCYQFCVRERIADLLPGKLRPQWRTQFCNERTRGNYGLWFL